MNDMKAIPFTLHKNDLEILVSITLLKSFEPCIDLIKTPFNKSSTILPDNFPFANFNEVVIKCRIDENEVTKILGSSLNPQAICVESIERFIEKNWPLKKNKLFKTLTCNPSESQYLYLIEK